ncbi:MAG: hypothetical protein AB1918_02310 [Pseudomonadota bacterium]
MPEDLETLRRRLQAALPARIQAALDGYDRFAADEPPADAKGFAAWHSAAKAALAHVEVLVKLARWAEGKAEEPDSGAGTGLDRLLAEARAALDGLDDDEEET